MLTEWRHQKQHAQSTRHHIIYHWTFAVKRNHVCFDKFDESPSFIYIVSNLIPSQHFWNKKACTMDCNQKERCFHYNIIDDSKDKHEHRFSVGFMKIFYKRHCTYHWNRIHSKRAITTQNKRINSVSQNIGDWVWKIFNVFCSLKMNSWKVSKSSSWLPIFVINSRIMVANWHRYRNRWWYNSKILDSWVASGVRWHRNR